MIWQLLLELREHNFEILELLNISECYAKWIYRHWNDTPLESESHGNVICEPHDDIRIDEDPDCCHEKRQWIIVGIPLTQRTWNRNVLQVSQRNKDDIPDPV